jgi:hypothetical protein
MTRIKLCSKRIAHADYIKAKTKLAGVGAKIVFAQTESVQGGGISAILEVEVDDEEELLVNEYLFDDFPGFTIRRLP